MGSYKACSPLSNGNLIVNCCSVQQMTTLLNCTHLTDGVVAVEVTASPRKPIGARGVIYNVPLDIPTDNILTCLAGQGVQSMRRFRYKSKNSSEMTESKSVFLQFTTADFPGEVKLGYMLFRVKQYNPRPLRCFKCNRYGHVANHCRGKLRCSICSGEHKYSECSAAAPKCPNCGGSHSANEKICPRYQRETEILNLETVANLSYADACKELSTSRNPPAPHLASQSTFPTLPKSTVDRTLAKPFLSATPCPRVTGTPLDQNELIVTEQTDFSSLVWQPSHLSRLLGRGDKANYSGKRPK